MPKINVYLPDDLADAVREFGVPLSSVCQRALEGAVRRAQAVRATVLDDGALTEQLQSFTTRATTVVRLAAERAVESGAPNVTTGDLLHGLLTEGGNMALQLLPALEVEPSSLSGPVGPEPSLTGPEPSLTGAAITGLRFSRPAASALEISVGEAIGLGHNYVGCEHLLIGLASEPDGTASALLRSRGLEGRTVRRSVAAALAGYAHLSRTTPTTAFRDAVRLELAPLIERIERLEATASPALSGGQE